MLANKGLVTSGQSPPWGDTDVSQGARSSCLARPGVPRVQRAAVNSKQSSQGTSPGMRRLAYSLLETPTVYLLIGLKRSHIH